MAALSAKVLRGAGEKPGTLLLGRALVASFARSDHLGSAHEPSDDEKVAAATSVARLGLLSASRTKSAAETLCVMGDLVDLFADISVGSDWVDETPSSDLRRFTIHSLAA